MRHRCSPKIFTQDIMVRLRAAIRKALKNIRSCGPRCVKWNEPADGEDDEDCVGVAQQATSASRHCSNNIRSSGRSGRHRRNRS